MSHHHCLCESSKILGSLGNPSLTSNIYKDECVYCFETTFDAHGLNVCLLCFEGFCNDHKQLHLDKLGHPLALNIVKERTESKEHKNITEIKVSEGNEEQNEKLVCATINCLLCNLPVEEDEKATTLKNQILQTNSARRKQQVAASSWSDQPLTACPHLFNLLAKREGGSPRESINQQCFSCELDGNLWLCLECGNVACGRAQWDGTGGRGHAKQHFEAASHPLATKLGTIVYDPTQTNKANQFQGDIYCYHCDEMLALTGDPAPLVQRLISLGLSDLSTKYEMSISELTVEQNQNFEFSMRDASGQVYETAAGPHCLPIKNLGNSCYMSSIIQACLSLSDFKHRYTTEHFKHCPRDAPLCVDCQMAKVVEEYEHPVSTHLPIAPWMLKVVLAAGNTQFSSSQQQDATEFFEHLVNVLERNSTGAELSPLFNLQTRQLLECTKCSIQKYGQYENTLTTCVNLVAAMNAVPLDGIERGVIDGKPVAFIHSTDCLENTFGPEEIDFTCEGCTERMKKSSIISPSGLPPYLVIQLGRFAMSNDGKVVKMDDLGISGLGTIDLASFVRDSSTAVSSTDDDNIQALQGMGFGACQSQVAASLFKSPEQAMDWLLGTGASEEDIQTLLATGFTVEKAGQALKASSGSLEEALNMLCQGGSTTQSQGVSKSISTRYELQAFVSHKGPSVHCGHYVAYVNSATDSWVLCNDDKLGKLGDPQEALQAASMSYLLFYKQV